MLGYSTDKSCTPLILPTHAQFGGRAAAPDQAIVVFLAPEQIWIEVTAQLSKTELN